MYDTTPGAAISEDLSLSQDAARTNLGAPWRMPTATEFQELFDNCSSVWTTMNGVSGRLFTSNVNGNTLFLPADGYYNGTTIDDRGAYGYYWSSSYNSPSVANIMRFSNSNINPQSTTSRRYGLSIRAVKDGTPNLSIVLPTSENEPKEEETPTTEEPKDDNQR